MHVAAMERRGVYFFFFPFFFPHRKAHRRSLCWVQIYQTDDGALGYIQ